MTDLEKIELKHTLENLMFAIKVFMPMKDKKEYEKAMKKNCSIRVWNKAAIKEQEKLEQEQMEVDCLKDIIKNIPNYRVGRCSGKSFYFIMLIELLLKYNVALEN